MLFCSWYKFVIGNERIVVFNKKFVGVDNNRVRQ